MNSCSFGRGNECIKKYCDITWNHIILIPPSPILDHNLYQTLQLEEKNIKAVIWVVHPEAKPAWFWSQRPHCQSCGPHSWICLPEVTGHFSSREHEVNYSKYLVNQLEPHFCACNSYSHSCTTKLSEASSLLLRLPEGQNHFLTLRFPQTISFPCRERVIFLEPDWRPCKPLTFYTHTHTHRLMP